MNDRRLGFLLALLHPMTWPLGLLWMSAYYLSFLRRQLKWEIAKDGKSMREIRLLLYQAATGPIASSSPNIF